MINAPETIYIALLGFGAANQALAELLLHNRARLLNNNHKPIRIVLTGVFTRSHGGAVCADGLDISSALNSIDDLSKTLSKDQAAQRVYDKNTKADTADVLAHLEFLKQAGKLDVLVEGIIANYEDAEPAVSFARWALSHGVHYCTANKAPVALFYDELTELGKKTPHHRLQGQGLDALTKFRFESACGDGVPLFSLARHALLGCSVTKFEGINNTTTNLILQKMEEENLSVAAGVALAQELGIAEADPSGDLEGYDAAVKCLCLARVMMQPSFGVSIPVDIASIPRDSFMETVTLEEVQALKREGKRIKMVCKGEIIEDLETGEQRVVCAVEKQIIDSNHPFYHVNGCDNIWRFSFDNLCPITMIQHDSETRDTGYGLFADLLDCVGYREII